MNDFIFARPLFLWGIAIVPVVIAALAFVQWRSRRKLQNFADESTLPRINTEASRVRRLLSTILIGTALVFVFLAAAQPKYGLKRVPVERRGVDLIIALDVSKSMETRDITPDRLQRARLSIENLIENMEGDRAGLVVFAGEAILLHPLTTRAAGFLLTLDTLNTDAVAVQGTAIGEAIRTAREGFEDTSLKNRVLILITDGETHDEEAISEAEEAADDDITIYTIGIGTRRGDKIPEYVREGEVIEYKKENGRYIFSKLNDALLNEIAEIGNGRYLEFTGGESSMLSRLYTELREKVSEEDTGDQEELMNDIYQIPLSVAVFFLVVATMVGNRRE